MKVSTGNKHVVACLPVLAFTAAIAQGGPLLPCTGTNYATQESTQTSCVLTNPGGSLVVTASYANDPTYLNTPVTQTVNDYQTTLTAILNGGTTVSQEIFNAPFGDPSVQAAILAADALFTSDGATFGSPTLTSNSTALQSSVLSYVATSPTFDVPTLLACGALNPVFTCSGVTVMDTITTTTTFGPNTIMTGLGSSDEFDILAGQTAINTNSDYTYTVDQNAVTTNTYLTTQSYEIDGTTGASAVPEPGTWMLAGCGLAVLAFRRIGRRSPAVSHKG
jgi:hypothetical protein